MWSSEPSLAPPQFDELPQPVATPLSFSSIIFQDSDHMAAPQKTTTTDPNVGQDVGLVPSHGISLDVGDQSQSDRPPLLKHLYVPDELLTAHLLPPGQREAN